METIHPLEQTNQTIIYVTDTSPIQGHAYGSKLPIGTVVTNHFEKKSYDIGGFYLVDYTEGNAWCEGSVIIAK